MAGEEVQFEGAEVELVAGVTVLRLEAAGAQTNAERSTDGEL